MRKSSVILVSICLAGIVGLGIFTLQQRRARAALVEASIVKGLSPQEITDVLKSEAITDRQSISALIEAPEKRAAFLKGMREYLALAAEARREGFADRPEFKINSAYKKDILVADLYRRKLSEGLGKLYIVPDAELTDVWRSKENVRIFNETMKTLADIREEDARQRGQGGSKVVMQGEMLEKARKNWARTRVLANRAKRDLAFIKLPVLDLRFKIIEAGILSSDYLRANYAKRIKPNSQEIEQFLAKHKELDPLLKKEKAEKTLNRIKSGEDFSGLAVELSEDRSSKKNDGIYKDIVSGSVWKEVENKLLTLKHGELFPELIESPFGWHIVQLISKTRGDANSDIRFSFKHIAFQKKFEDSAETPPGIPAPFLTPLEIAVASIERQKRRSFLDRVIAENPISLPEDFEVKLPVLSTDSANKRLETAK